MTKKHTNVKGITAFLTALSVPVVVIFNVPHWGGGVSQALKNIETARKAGHVVRIEDDCLSACTMWTTYERVCTTRDARFGAHYAFLRMGSLTVRSRSGTKRVIENVTPTLARATQAAFDANLPGNPVTWVSGAVLIARGEVPECK